MTEPDRAPSDAVTYRPVVRQPTVPELAVIVVKLLGLYTILDGLPQLTYIPVLIWQSRLGFGSVNWMQMAYLLPPASYFGIGMLLLFGAEWVVSRVLRVPLVGLSFTEDSEHLQALAFSVVGVALMITGIAGIVGHIATFIALKAQDSPDPFFHDVGYIRGIQPFVEVVLGALVFLRGRGLASLWHRMRYGGVRVREAE